MFYFKIFGHPSKQKLFKEMSKPVYVSFLHNSVLYDLSIMRNVNSILYASSSLLICRADIWLLVSVIYISIH